LFCRPKLKFETCVSVLCVLVNILLTSLSFNAVYFVLGKYILRVFNISLYQSLLSDFLCITFLISDFCGYCLRAINPFNVYKVCSSIWSRVYFVQEWILPSINDVFGCRKCMSHYFPVRPKFKQSCYQISDVLYKLVQLLNLYQKIINVFY